MPTNLFVYGTLMFPEVTNHLEIASCDLAGNPSSELRRAKATLLGYERFTVRFRERGNFPAIVPAPDAINGDVFFDLTDESIRKLDLFEGVKEGYYVRKSIRVGHALLPDAHEPIQAETYVCGDLIRDKLDGPWDPEQFRKNELDWYVKNLF